jgi:hypothetical protein
MQVRVESIENSAVDVRILRGDEHIERASGGAERGAQGAQKRAQRSTVAISRDAQEWHSQPMKAKDSATCREMQIIAAK